MSRINSVLETQARVDARALEWGFPETVSLSDMLDAEAMIEARKRGLPEGAPWWLIVFHDLATTGRVEPSWMAKVALDHDLELEFERAHQELEEFERALTRWGRYLCRAAPT